MGATVARRIDEPPALRVDEVPRERVRLVIVDAARPTLTSFAALPSRLRAGDLVVVNDAATLPASLRGRTLDGDAVELRLTGPIEAGRLRAVLFGAGDHRTRTEDRPLPPALAIGDEIVVGASRVRVAGVAGRLVEVVSDDDLVALVYAHGVPVQYAHRVERLPLWSVQTAYATRPWAAEMPSAGRALTWEILLGLRQAGVELAAVTEAAGLSSTGDAALDALLPLPERYMLPQATVDAIARTRARGGRVIAIGTSVVRALEAAARGGLVAGEGIARLRIGPYTALRVVDGLVSGLHVPGESHFELLQAFASRAALHAALAVAAAHGLSGHELGDACLLVRR